MASLLLNLQYQLKISAYIGHIHFKGVKDLLSNVSEHSSLNLNNFFGSSNSKEDPLI